MPYVTIHLKYRCVPSYSSSEEETDDYAPGWVVNQDGNRTDVDALSEAYRHKTAEELDGNIYIGIMDTYPGGGYVADLGLTAIEAGNMVENLRLNRWIDQFTRVVFFEFNSWNPNSQLFNAFQLVFEMTPIGEILWSASVENVQLYRYAGASGVLALAVEIGCGAFVFVIIVLEGLKLRRLRFGYFRHFWNYVQFVSLSLFVVAAIMYIMRSIWTTRSVEDLMNNPGMVTSRVFT